MAGWRLVTVPKLKILEGIFQRFQQQVQRKSFVVQSFVEHLSMSASCKLSSELKFELF